MAKMNFEPPKRLQFRLSYLLYVLTVFAVGFAALRRVIFHHLEWKMTTFELVLVGALIAYFVIRVPILFRRWRRGASKVASHKQQMSELVAEMKNKRE